MTWSVTHSINTQLIGTTAVLFLSLSTDLPARPRSDDLLASAAALEIEIQVTHVYAYIHVFCLLPRGYFRVSSGADQSRWVTFA